VIEGLCRLAVCVGLVIGGGAAHASTLKGESNAKIICKHDATTGSRLGKKRCLTKGEWERASVQTQREARDYLKRPTQKTQ
jgi:hypothetical protein